MRTDILELFTMTELSREWMGPKRASRAWVHVNNSFDLIIYAKELL